MIRLHIQRALLVAAAAVATYRLAEQYGTWTGLLIWASVMAVACGTGTILLRTSTIGRVTWRNRAAGYLIPWGWRFNRGLLWPVPVVSWVVWTAVGATVVLLRQGEGASGLRVALFAAWVLDAGALIFILGAICQATPGGRMVALWKLVTLIAALIATSVGLYLYGLPTAALIVGSGPPLLVSGGVGGIVLIFATFGRNTRWN
ncbi:unnamed protein product [Gemmata massiliana]|uniref:Uncharacterized protein n=1 Tax=Gemmata massiliana TaxID=1210884 RepID=A0A6P2CU36_9BACT|nr:hypothetical protein [Gemmata massiliana]VTR92423.1 unnamed protein product [Gemmata massiliana]